LDQEKSGNPDPMGENSANLVTLSASCRKVAYGQLLQIPDLFHLFVTETVFSTITPRLPDFSFFNIPKWENIYQITTKYTKWR
jgi:hypothetical protein